MREIPLTRGYIALVDDEDFERVNELKWHVKIVRIKDAPRYMYACSRNILLHRFIEFAVLNLKLRRER